MDFRKTSAQIVQKIKSSSFIVLSSHEQPDPDALGSLLGMAGYLQWLGKEFQVVLAGQEITNPFFKKHLPISKEPVDWEEADLLIALDSGDKGRLAIGSFPEEKELAIVNIDHHFSNTFFGDINLVDAQASSTTEILTKFFQEIGFFFAPPIATGLLFGLLSDTDNFTNKGTSSSAFGTASYLLKKGANLAKVNFYIKKDNHYPALRIWGNILSRLKVNKKNKLAYTIVTKEEIEKAKASGSEEKIEELVNFLNNLKGYRLVMVVKEQDEGVRVSLRTNRDDIDVSRLALLFGGGGHKKAAGFKIKNKLSKINGSWRIS